jgi:hypothetical protein
LFANFLYTRVVFSFPFVFPLNIENSVAQASRNSRQEISYNIKALNGLLKLRSSFMKEKMMKKLHEEEVSPSSLSKTVDVVLQS